MKRLMTAIAFTSVVLAAGLGVGLGRAIGQTPSGPKAMADGELKTMLQACLQSQSLDVTYCQEVAKEGKLRAVKKALADYDKSPSPSALTDIPPSKMTAVREMNDKVLESTLAACLSSQYLDYQLCAEVAEETNRRAIRTALAERMKSGTGTTPAAATNSSSAPVAPTAGIPAAPTPTTTAPAASVPTAPVDPATAWRRAAEQDPTCRGKRVIAIPGGYICGVAP